ncbi:methyltransferase [Phenylobacterium sp.]|jgi:predicted methyltransferase|uniref:class I SAM-dependent methyltransferase n=1 Tax=Phenylobacterium sp. TaxID=1871053 RepID=UPI002F415466
MKTYRAVGFAGLIAVACALSAAAAPSNLATALSDPRRPASDVAKDTLRKPAAVLAFAGVKPGERVGDVFVGNAYLTRILSAAVGPKGRVYGFIPAEMARNCDPSEFAGAHLVEHDPRFANVRILTQPAERLAAGEPLDLVISSQNYHDLFDRFMEHADVAAVDRSLFRALRPGGVLLVVDHAAEAGSGVRDTERLHRIDPAEIRRRLEAAGFVYDGASDALRNPADDHRLRVFDPKIRGRTDQVILRFRKPA